LAYLYLQLMEMATTALPGAAPVVVVVVELSPGLQDCPDWTQRVVVAVAATAEEGTLVLPGYLGWTLMETAAAVAAAVAVLEVLMSLAAVAPAVAAVAAVAADLVGSRRQESPSPIAVAAVAVVVIERLKVVVVVVWGLRVPP
jgi:hypothetical protein